MKKANFLLLPLLGFMVAGCATNELASVEISSVTSQEVETNSKTTTKKEEGKEEESKTDWSEQEKTLMKNCLYGYVFPYITLPGGSWEELDDLYYFADNVSTKQAHDFYQTVANYEGFVDVSLFDYDPSETEEDFYREAEIFPREDLLIHCVFGFTGENKEKGHFAMMVEAPFLETKETLDMDTNQTFIQEIAGDEQAALPLEFPFEFTYLYSILYSDDTDNIAAMTFTIYTENENCCELYTAALKQLNLYTLGEDKWGNPDFEGHGLYGWYMYQPGNKTFYLDIGKPEIE